MPTSIQMRSEAARIVVAAVLRHLRGFASVFTSFESVLETVAKIVANKISSEGVERMLGELNHLGATVDGHSYELTILEAQAEEFKEDLDALKAEVVTFGVSSRSSRAV